MRYNLNIAAAGILLGFVSLNSSVAAAVSEIALPISADLVSADLERRIDADIAAVLHRYDVPGAVVAIFRDGNSVYSHAYGLRDQERQLPALVGTDFEIGSITKQFTAAAILQLQEAGKLSIDATVATYLPDAPHAGEITLRQLLSHTSGLPEFLDGPNIEEEATKPIAFPQLVGRIAGKPLDFPPGAKWAYSNTGYILLGRIIEIVSHETYDHYIKTHIFQPLGMTHTYTVADEANLPTMATGYHHVGGKRQLASTINESFGWAAGNIVSTIDDLNNWNDALRAGKIITKTDYTMMATSVKTEQGDAGYGLGLFVDDVDDQPRVGHTGGSFGFTTANEYFPRQNLQIIAFTNSGDDGPEPGDVLTQVVFDDVFPDIAAAAARPTPGADPAIKMIAESTFASLQSGKEDYATFNAHLGGKMKAGLAERLAKELASYGRGTAFIFKDKREAADLKWSDYLIQFGPGCFMKFGIALDQGGKIASISIG